MVSSVGDLVINLLASVIAGTAVWSFQRFRRRRRDERRRRFFGLSTRAECVIVAPRHASSPSPHSVNQLDVAAIVELATVARECGADVALKVQGHSVLFDSAFDSATEFCVGGPEGNRRTGAHLATFVPGASMDPYEEVGDLLTLRVGDEEFPRKPGEAEFVLLAKVDTGKEGRPLFLVCGQTAVTNRAAARYLTRNYRTLASRHGLDGRFCLILEVVRPSTYGDRVVRERGDFTSVAFTSPA
ncbi:hypothetical protein [Saccharomonospora cyanea]|uniref:Secreted protein n=1 Tax=Saccharomonospora cyanea NA-134 TaxID=882082 RepID=H5XCY5_9PSEU|nr:hypothetical protein [Saccharomonospora cyanea]EHR62382.1 hypothetical protein SaccyDRAFT_3554 [Saccharomonospora cyanea NA-134]